MRDLEHLSSKSRERAHRTLNNLCADLRPPGSRRLWLRHAYRVADIDAKVFYSIDVDRGNIRVITIQPRESGGSEANDAS